MTSSMQAYPEVFPDLPPKHGMFISMGPQHPSTHGVLRVAITVDGEIVTSAQPDIGYLHRGTEKLAEVRTYPQNIVLTDRLDYLAAMTNNLSYCLAVEKLMKLAVPERAQVLRVVVSELQRIASHLVFIGTYGIDIGAFTPFLVCFGRERELILDLFEELCGARLTYNYVRIGGVSHDAPSGWLKKTKEFVGVMRRRTDEYDTLLTHNPIFKDRTQNVGKMSLEMAIDFGLSGPNLRATGATWDVRRADPYSGYEKYRFEIPAGKQGDCWERYWVRVEEIKQSLNILDQALDLIQEGDCLSKLPKFFKVPAGESYAHIEAPRGDLGFYLISDGSDKPYRMHIRAPSFINLQVLQKHLVGHLVADVVAILGSIDVVLGEVDR